MNATKNVIGVDIAKQVFQVHEVDIATGEINRVQLKRARFLEYFVNRASCFDWHRACGGAQHWARRLIAQGHTVKLLPAKVVRPFVGGNKNDAADARAIWTAVQQPGIKTVAVKTEAQQAVLAIHRMRQQLVKFRMAQINARRGLLIEYGEVMPHKETPQVAFIEGEIIDHREMDLDALVRVDNATVMMRLANGKLIVLRNAWFAGEGTDNTEEGNIALRLEGMSGEEVRS